MAIEKPGYADYIAKLSEVSGVDIKNVDDLMKALEKRMDYFISVGCVVTDHSLEGCFYQPATVEDVDRVMKKRLEGEELTAAECGMYKGYVMIALGKMYARKNIVMQLHIGALRNNSSRQLAAIGKQYRDIAHRFAGVFIGNDMGIGDDVAVGGHDHAGALGGAHGQQGGDGHHRGTYLPVDLLEGEGDRLRPVRQGQGGTIPVGVTL